ncbi:hypothetical protein R3P38DRAFT_2767053 [Favolaschia claudopus]|uniref:Uncharacterized protein n=1 Tax=Favolaschia claudopus TaxID=2862362 RepID=A0AAW0CYP0_9AGAR
MDPYPPLKSKFIEASPAFYSAPSPASTNFELDSCSFSGDSPQDLRRLRRNERARLRMAAKRAEIRSRGPEVQAEYAQRARDYMAKYRERHRHRIRKEETRKRFLRYKEMYGKQHLRYPQCNVPRLNQQCT